MSTMLSKLFKPGLARHAVFINPCADVSEAASCGEPEPRRQRLELAEPELRTALPALPTIGADNALALNLLLLRICTRIGQLAKAEWAYVAPTEPNGLCLMPTQRPGRASPCRWRRPHCRASWPCSC